MSRHLFPLSLALLLGAGGCVTGRLNQFHNFAQAGAAYVEASQTVLTQAGTAAIGADSLVALSGRESLKTAEARRRYIVGNDQELHKRLVLLQQIGEHGKILQSYFESLAALADPKPPSSLEAAAKGLYSSMLQLSPALKNGSLGGENIQNKIPPVTDFVVQTYETRALERELKLRSKDIERELALQEAAFTVIADNLTTDLTVQLQLLETQEVIEPFAASVKLPARWVSRRQDILQARMAAVSAQSAVKAATELRENFMALVENRLSEASILAMIRSMHSIRDLREQIEKVSH